MTDVEAAKLLTLLVTAFPDGLRFLDPDQQRETRALYRRFMIDIPYEIGDAAIARLIATAKRWPAIGELRATFATYMHGRRRSGAEAYGDLRAALGREPVFADPVVGEVIDAMGWRAFCNSPEGCPAFRARFIDEYDKRATQRAEDLAVGSVAPPIPRPRLSETRGGALPVGGIVAGLLPKE